MSKTVFISRELDESSVFASRLQAAGWAVQGFSLVTLAPLPVEAIPAADWIFFASGNAVRFFFGETPPPKTPPPETSGGGVSAGGALRPKASVYSTDITQWKYLKKFAREMRKQPTEAENLMWKALRGAQIEGLKFRRQHAIDDFIVDFLNLDLRLIVEVDGSIHDIQPEYDKLRTEWLTVLGYEVIRFTNEEVIGNLPLVKQRLKKEIQRLRKGGVSTVSWAALGPATARELKKYTGRVDFTGTGDPATTADLFRPLAAGRRVLFPAARHSQRSISNSLGDAIEAIHLAVYDNAPAPDPPRIDAAVLVFTSPMNAAAYFARHALQTRQRVVAIGRTTADGLAGLGIHGVRMAAEPSEFGLAEAVFFHGQ